MGRIHRSMDTGRLQQQATSAQDALDREYKRYYGLDMKQIRARQTGQHATPSQRSALMRSLRRVGRGGRGAADAALGRQLVKLLTVKPLFDAAGRAGAVQRQLGNLSKLGRQKATAAEYWLRKRRQAYRNFEKKYDNCTTEACRRRVKKEYRRNKWGTRLPKSGKWDGEPGNSKWRPDPGTPAAKALKEHGQTGVQYRNGHPDFGPVSKANVPIDGMKGNTGSDFTKARNAMGPGYDRRVMEKGYTWHHHQNTRNMQLVDSRIHNTVYDKMPTGGAVHTGGASAVKDPVF